VHSNKFFVRYILVIVDIPLNLISPDVVGQLISQGVVVEFDRNERKDAVDGITLRRDLGNGYISNDDREN